MKGLYKKVLSYVMILVMCIGSTVNVSYAAANETNSNAGNQLVTPSVTLTPNTKRGGGGITYTITDTANDPADVAEYNIGVYEKLGDTYTKIGDFNTEGSDFVTLNDGENLVAGQEYAFTVIALAKKKSGYFESEESQYSNTVVAAGKSNAKIKGKVNANTNTNAGTPFVTPNITLPLNAENDSNGMTYVVADTTVKIIGSNGTRDITAKLVDRYITDNENLMIPAETIYKEMGLTQIEWGIRDNVKVLCAVNPLDNRNTGVNYAEFPTYAVNGEYGGTLDPTPVFQDGIAMIAIQSLEKLWKIPVKFDTTTKTYYIVMDKNKMGSTIAALPDAEAGENLMAVKKSNSDPNTIKVNLVINGKSKDITTTAIPQNSNGDLMINVKPILRSLDAVIIQNKEKCFWGGLRSLDNRVYIVYYETGVMANGYNNSNLDGVNAAVKPKLINDLLLLYYKDIEKLTGGTVTYDTKTKTCTISITDEWLANNAVDNITNYEVVTDQNQNTANTNPVKESATAKNSKTAQQKEREREALERQREREREREREERQKRLAELEAELEQLQKEREARERQREEAERAKEEALQKTRKVLIKGKGFVYESEIEDNSNSSNSASNSEQKTRRVLRAGVGWVWE